MVGKWGNLISQRHSPIFFRKHLKKKDFFFLSKRTDTPPIPPEKPPVHSLKNMSSHENTNWVFDYGLIEDIPVPDANFTASVSGFTWPIHAFDGPANVSVETDSLLGDSHGPKETGVRKRARTESSGSSSSKACREKLRRDRLNDKFVELGSVLEPDRPPKTDKNVILIDAVRMVTQLRSEAQKLRDSNADLQEKIKELKTEKNELRSEKQRLKAEKEKMEEQLKAVSMHPGFLPSSPIPAAFAPAQGQPGSNKMMPFMGYPGVSMWQFMPPASVDTSQDHVLRPPVA